MNIRRLKQTLKQVAAFSLLALLAACGSTVPPAVSPGGTGYLLTVNLEQSDTREGVTQRYGGEVIAWMDDKAILKMSEEAVAQMQARGISLQNTTLDPNSNVATPATMQGWNAWGSGWNAWGSGWNAWGSGWNAWSGGTGTVPTLPSNNRAAFMQLKLPQAQALARNFGSGIKVAVIDTGLDTAHPMFMGRLAPSAQWKDYVDGDANPQEVSGGSGFGHGTAVAGLILQAAPRATILPIRVLGNGGSGSVDNVVSAIDWARQQGAHIINLSLGTDVDVAALKTQISYVNSLGIFVIASAGNSGGSLSFPAASAQSAPHSDKLWSVGSVNNSGSRSSFSSFGSALKFSAPGEGLVSAYPGNQTATVRGTSFAAPIISGVLALAMSETSSSNWNSLQFWLANSTFGSSTTGSLFGVVNSVSFLQKLPGIQLTNTLFVHGGTSPNSRDSLLISRLQSLGHLVTTRSSSVATSADATNRKLIVISDTSLATQVGTKFTSVAVPLVTWRHDLFDDLAMTNTSTSQYGIASGQNTINLTNSTHPLAAGLATLSDLQVNSNNQTNIAWGVPTTGATIIARRPGSSTQMAFFAYDTNAQMVGRTAPARRVGFFLQDGAVNSLTTTGWTLFEATMTWAVSGN